MVEPQIFCFCGPTILGLFQHLFLFYVNEDLFDCIRKDTTKATNLSNTESAVLESEQWSEGKDQVYWGQFGSRKIHSLGIAEK